MRKWGLTAVVALALVTLVACAQGVERPETVAVVNGEAISHDQLDARVDQVRHQYAVQGIDIDQDGELLERVQAEALDELIDEALLLGYADDQGIAVTREEIDAEYELLVQEVQGEDVLEELLSARGMDRDQLMDLIADQLVLFRLQDHERKERGLEITEDALRETYNAYRDMIPDIPSFDEVRPYLEQELEHQQFMEIVPELLEDLRDAGEVKVYL